MNLQNAKKLIGQQRMCNVENRYIVITVVSVDGKISIFAEGESMEVDQVHCVYSNPQGGVKYISMFPEIFERLSSIQ